MVRVVNKGKGKLNLRFGVSLPPGAEVEVSPEMWGKCKDDPITKHYLSIQQVQVVAGSSQLPPTDQGGEPAAPEPEPETEAIEVKVVPLEEWPKLKVKEVTPLVGELHDQADLKKLLTLDTRPTVRTAIEHRLEELREV